MPQITDATDGFATWATLLLPYLEQGSVYSMWDLTKQCSRQAPAAYRVNLKVYWCPSRPAQVFSRLSMRQTALSASGVRKGLREPAFDKSNTDLRRCDHERSFEARLSRSPKTGEPFREIRSLLIPSL